MYIKGQEVMYIKESDLRKIRAYLYNKEKIVFLAFLNIGVNVGLRISDLGRLRFEEITTDYSIYIKEKKTGKQRCIMLNNTCKEALKMLKAFYKNIGHSTSIGYLFKSLSPYNLKHNLDTPYKTAGVAKQFKKIREELNINYPLGSHSLRKTWGNRIYKKTGDIGLIMKMFRHTSLEQTLRYIGIEEERIREVYYIVEV